MQYISSSEVVSLMASPVPHAVLDVRDFGAFTRGHIFQSTPCPRSLLEERLPSLVPDRAIPVVLCDQDGGLCLFAASLLEDMGYESVRIMQGGLSAWAEQGLPLVQGFNVPGKVFGERIARSGAVSILSVEDFDRLRGREPLVIDVRPWSEHVEGCVPGALNVPGVEIVRTIADLTPRAEGDVVLHCAGRTRSLVAAATLARMNFPIRVHALENGTMGWVLSGRELAYPDSVPGAESVCRASSKAIDASRCAIFDISGVGHMSSEALQGLLNGQPRLGNIQVFDVRTELEFEAGHIPGSLNVPGGQLLQTVDEWIAVRAGLVIVVCDDGIRSGIAAHWLREMGYPNVYVLMHGIDGWRESRRAVERGASGGEPYGCAQARKSVEMIQAESVKDRVILDVSTSREYEGGHIPGAVWVGRTHLHRGIAQLGLDKETSIALVSHDECQAFLAGAELRQCGYADVRVVAGGTRSWDEFGQGLEVGASTTIIEPDDWVQEPYDQGDEAMAAYLRWEVALDSDGQSPYELFSGAGVPEGDVSDACNH